MPSMQFLRSLAFSSVNIRLALALLVEMNRTHDSLIRTTIQSRIYQG